MLIIQIRFNIVGERIDANFIYDHKISDKFNYGSDRTRTYGVICP